MILKDLECALNKYLMYAEERLDEILELFEDTKEVLMLLIVLAVGIVITL